MYDKEDNPDGLIMPGAELFVRKVFPDSDNINDFEADWETDAAVESLDSLEGDWNILDKEEGDYLRVETDEHEILAHRQRRDTDLNYHPIAVTLGSEGETDVIRDAYEASHASDVTDEEVERLVTDAIDYLEMSEE